MNVACVFWFTGLSGSGKTTVAKAAYEVLKKKELKIYIIDGDSFRRKNGPKLGFTRKDVLKNNQAVLKECLKNQKKYEVIIVSMISPLAEARTKARLVLGKRFFEIYFNAGLPCVIRRDVKGLYRKAASGLMLPMIGTATDRPYEKPDKPDLKINTARLTLKESVRRFVTFVNTRLQVH